ncbi:MAG: hypothetical protein KatS3mg071_1736 [Meiothermus sp.]|nr:MAG: hypothetical protein KatS3mg071_1736 [Meiothermus sp.]
MVFTRNYIAGDATCNDIDAIAPKAGIVLELKKPRSELAQWYPWREDCANYNVIAWIGQQLGWRAITIAYNEDIPHNASLFKEVRCTSPSKRLTFHERRDLFLNDDSSFVRSLRNAFAQL